MDGVVTKKYVTDGIRKSDIKTDTKNKKIIIFKCIETNLKREKNRGRCWLHHFSVWDIVLMTSPLSDPLYLSINVDDGRIFSIVLLQKVN